MDSNQDGQRIVQEVEERLNKTIIFDPKEEYGLPDEVKILHKIFTLRERDFKESFGNTRLAEINFMQNEINYLPLGGSETVDSIVHEILHGIVGMFNINFKLTEAEEEYIVSTLATGLVTVMKDNPDLFYSLQDMLEDE